jgi:hypothetical protein
MSEKRYAINGVPVHGTLKEVVDWAVATKTAWTASIVSHQFERVAEVGSDGVVWIRYDYCEELRDESS